MDRAAAVTPSDAGRSPSLWLLRHGETEWTITGQHTGRTDVPLTLQGERQATALQQQLAGREFALVLTSPLRRARDTARLAGRGDVAELDPDLLEWDYGALEGKTTAEIREEFPGWNLWHAGAPGGESPHDVARRAERVIARAAAADGDTAIFAHGHLLRILAARWIGQDPSLGALLSLDTASVSILGFERNQRAIRHWNIVARLNEG